jgi:hypothetical protein
VAAIWVSSQGILNYNDLWKTLRIPPTPQHEENHIGREFPRLMGKSSLHEEKDTLPPNALGNFTIIQEKGHTIKTNVYVSQPPPRSPIVSINDRYNM